MRNPAYLTLSDYNVYHFRWPLLLQDKRHYVKVSLETREPKQALHLAKALAYHAEALMQQGWVMAMDGQEVRRLVRSYIQGLLVAMRRQITEDGPLSQESIEELTRIAAVKPEDYTGQGFGHWDEAMPVLMKQHGLALDKDSEDYKQIGQALNLAFPPFAKELLRLNEEINGFDFTPTGQPSATAYLPPSSKHRLKDMVRAYIRAHTGNPNPKDNVWDENTKKGKEA